MFWGVILDSISHSNFEQNSQEGFGIVLGVSFWIVFRTVTMNRVARGGLGIVLGWHFRQYFGQ